MQRLVPLQAEGEEGVCGGVRFRVQCVVNDVSLPLKELQGRPVAVSIDAGRDGRRVISGIVERVGQGPSDHLAAIYEIEFCDALAILDRRRTWRPFTDMSVVEISARILGEHRHRNGILGAAFKFSTEGLLETYPQRAFTLQAGESDAAFLTRLWRQEGIAWFFRATLEDGYPVHTLVLADHPRAYADNPAGRVRYQRVEAAEADTVVDFGAWRRLAPAAATRASFDYKQVGTDEANVVTRLVQGEAGDELASTLIDYDYDAPRFGAEYAHYERMGLARIRAHESAAKGWNGESVVRLFAAGTSVELDGHPEIDRHPAEQRRFTLTRLRIYVRNGARLEARLAASLFRGWNSEAATAEHGDAPDYRNRFECVRRGVPIVPVYDPETVPRVGMLSAIVVGSPGNEIDVDDKGRILVAFPFTRSDEAPDGRGVSDGMRERPCESARIRVAQAWADDGFGAAMWPRVGSEILVAFIQGHPDKPVALNAGLYNGTHDAPRFSGRGSLPANAALYGFRTKELKGDRHNQLRFDDHFGEIGVQAGTDHAATQLNLGWIGTPRDEGRSEPRGEGFELATDAAGALRTARGLLISAFARLNASGKQLSREETLGLMEQSLELFKQLGAYAAQHEGQAIDEAPHARMRDDLRDWENGSNTAPGGAGGGAPIVAMTAPAGIHLNTPETVVTHAGGNVDTVALRHIQLASAERLIANAGRGVSLFAQSEGMRFIAHQGPLLLQSQHDATTINAATDLKLTASDGRVAVMGAREIVLAEAGGAYIKLAGGRVEIGGPADFLVKMAHHVWSGPASGSVDLPRFDKGDLGRTQQLVRPTDGQPVEGMRFEITRSDGSVLSGTTDAAGKAPPLEADAFEHLQVRYLEPDA